MGDRGLAKLVGYKQVHEALGVSRSTLRRMVDEGKLPAPKRLSPGATPRWFRRRRGS